MRAPTPYRIRGDEIDPPEQDYEAECAAYDQYQEDKFERERDEETEREIFGE